MFDQQLINNCNEIHIERWCIILALNKLARKCINWRPIIFDEVWKPITKDVVPYIMPYYSISSYGRIYSTFIENYLMLTIDKHGYVMANLHLEPGNPITKNRKVDQTSVRVNRLVLASFNPIEGWQNLICNHKDSVRSNNYIGNLEWVTEKENTLHGLNYGFREIQDISGEKNPMHKLTKNQVIQIVELLNSDKLTYKEIANKFNVRVELIRDIASGQHWSSVTNGLLNEYAFKMSRAYSNEEIFSILQYFEDNKDILNDRNIFPSLNSIVIDCLVKTGLIKNHPVEASRKTIISYLRKTNSAARKIYDNYTYHYNY